MEREMDHRGYVCPECQTKYSALEAMRHCEQFLNEEGNMDFRFICKIDQILLEEDQHSEVLQHGNMVLEQLYTQNQKIMELIRECDQVKLPKYIVMEPSSKKMKLEEESHHAVKVEFLKEAQAPEALPIWHRQSTVMQATPQLEVSLPSEFTQNDPADAHSVDDYYKTYLTEYSQKLDTDVTNLQSTKEQITLIQTSLLEEEVFTDEEFEDLTEKEEALSND